MIEGPHKSLEDVMRDPTTTTGSLVDFAGQAEDAVRRCNDDKAEIKRAIGGSR